MLTQSALNVEIFLHSTKIFKNNNNNLTGDFRNCNDHQKTFKALQRPAKLTCGARTLPPASLPQQPAGGGAGGGGETCWTHTQQLFKLKR